MPALAPSSILHNACRVVQRREIRITTVKNPQIRVKLRPLNWPFLRGCAEVCAGEVGQKGTEQVIESNLRLEEQTAPHKSVPAVKELTEDSSQREESYIANWVAY
jgi:hypothetical protein